MFSPVLGAVPDISQIIGLCVLVISVISWFINIVQGNTPDGVPRGKQQNPKPPSARSEIEVLLEQISGSKKKPTGREQQGQAPRPPRPQQERSTNTARTNTARANQARPGSQSPKPAAKQASRVADMHLASSNLGNEVRSHQMGNRVDAVVQQEITAAVQHDLGNRIAAAKPVQDQAVHPLIKVLRDPNGIRQAILLNEILQRPKAKRHV
ncbi:MAG: hypothetical protein WCH39_22515 [Schlesneria sp.]